MMSDSRNREKVRHALTQVIDDAAAVPTLSPRDMDFAFRVARRARLLGRLAHSLLDSEKAALLPQTAVDQLEGAAAMARARARLAMWELDRIARAMTDSPETPLVIMKGCAYLVLELPNAPGRVFADVDLLTAEGCLGDVERCLNERGWETRKLSPYDQNYYRNWTHELPPMVHEEREVEIDLHHNVLPRTARLNPSSAKLLESAQPLPDSRYRVLGSEDILLHAMTHLMFDADLADQLRDLLDIRDIALHFAASEECFWQRLVSRAVELDLTLPAYYSLRYCQRLLDADIPVAVMNQVEDWAPPKPLRWMMDQCVPRALYPQHPDAPDRVTEFCRLLMYVRSHWIRMPPWLLVYHLSYKFLVTRFGKNTAQA